MHSRSWRTGIRSVMRHSLPWRPRRLLTAARFPSGQFGHIPHMVRNISYRILLAAPLAVSLLGDARAAAVPAAGGGAPYALPGGSGGGSGGPAASRPGPRVPGLGGGPVAARAPDA